jgi:2-hydroxymuconate-semialdehyde hydrolase
MTSQYAEKNFDFEGCNVHYIVGGSGFPILLLHGSGPGASTIGNWRKVLDPLALRYNVYAMDLIGFGKSSRRPAPPYFDIALWLRQALEMIRRIEGETIGLIGHSVSGALSLKLAAIEPRISKVLVTGTMGASFPLNEGTVRTWTFPKDRDALRAAAETLIYDKSLIDEAYLRNREAVLYMGDYEPYFSVMFGGDQQSYIEAAVLSPEELGRITCDVTMLHGRDDVAFPPEVTLTLARILTQANVHLIGRCSHSVAFEHPSALVSDAELLFPRI